MHSNNKAKAILLLVFSLIKVNFILSQFAGAAGTVGSTAIFKDSSIFVNWANNCQITRGYQNIADTSLGFTTIGSASSATGIAGSNGIVSLGDKGFAILTFPYPIKNGSGYDFAVFENAFIDSFLELATVEVSSNGIHYFAFKTTSNTQITSQITAFQNKGNPTLLNNLAGKYKSLFGTPFNLDELTPNKLLNLDSITHIKITDVCGSINPKYATFDNNNNPINDPFPTPFPSGGFDLDAVGVIHQNKTVSVNKLQFNTIVVYPNPTTTQLYLSNIKNNSVVNVFSMQGKLVLTSTTNPIQIKNIPVGTYIVKVENTPYNSTLFTKF